MQCAHRRKGNPTLNCITWFHIGISADIVLRRNQIVTRVSRGNTPCNPKTIPNNVFQFGRIIVSKQPKMSVTLYKTQIPCEYK